MLYQPFLFLCFPPTPLHLHAHQAVSSDSQHRSRIATSHTHTSAAHMQHAAASLPRSKSLYTSCLLFQIFETGAGIVPQRNPQRFGTLQHTATHCNTHQHNTAHCDTMHCVALWQVAVPCWWLTFHVITHCHKSVAIDCISYHWFMIESRLEDRDRRTPSESTLPLPLAVTRKDVNILIWKPGGISVTKIWQWQPASPLRRAHLELEQSEKRSRKNWRMSSSKESQAASLIQSSNNNYRRPHSSVYSSLPSSLQNKVTHTTTTTIFSSKESQRNSHSKIVNLWL